MAFDVWSVIEPAALDVVHKHVMPSREIEVGGFLIGTHGDDSEPPRCVAAIEGRGAIGDLTRLTFTHDTWEHVHRVLEADYEECSIIGWYHSHPGHGIFLSEHDRFIHRNFFSAPWQIAVVVDPVHATEGLFCWTRGELKLASERSVGEARTTTAQADAGAFTGRARIDPSIKRGRLVVYPDEPATPIAEPGPPPTDPRPSQTTRIMPQPASGRRDGQTLHVPTPRLPVSPEPVALVVLTAPARQPPPAPPAEPWRDAPHDAPQPARAAHGPRYPFIGHLLPVAAGVVAGIVASFAIF